MPGKTYTTKQLIEVKNLQHEYGLFRGTSAINFKSEATKMLRKLEKYPSVFKEEIEELKIGM